MFTTKNFKEDLRVSIGVETDDFLVGAQEVSKCGFCLRSSRNVHPGQVWHANDSCTRSYFD